MKGTKPFQNIPKNIHFVSSVGYAFALPRVKMRVLSKGTVSFHLKLKAPWKYVNTNKNVTVRLALPWPPNKVFYKLSANQDVCI